MSKSLLEGLYYFPKEPLSKRSSRSRSNIETMRWSRALDPPAPAI